MERIRKIFQFLKDYQASFALILSIITIGIVVYTNFLHGPSLSANINQINLMRLSETAKGPLLFQMLFDDLLSDSPSNEARLIIKNNPNAAKYILAKDRAHLDLEIKDQLAKKPATYSPSASLVERYIGKKEFFPVFLHTSND